jgi:hypothetical protein
VGESGEGSRLDFRRRLTIHESGARPNARSFGEKFDDLDNLYVVKSQSVQRLSLAEAFAAAHAKEALHYTISIPEFTGLLTFT